LNQLHPSLNETLASTVVPLCEGMGAAGCHSVNPPRRKSGHAQGYPPADAIAQDIGAPDPGVIEHCDYVPAAMDRAICKRIDRVTAVAVAA
jgi:hypothetical protein